MPVCATRFSETALNEPTVASLAPRPLRKFATTLAGAACDGGVNLSPRAARVTYIDKAQGTPLERNGFLLEDDDDAMARVGGKAELSLEAFGSVATRGAAADAARIAFAEAMIGNFDWCLKFSPDDIYRCNGRNHSGLALVYFVPPAFHTVVSRLYSSNPRSSSPSHRPLIPCQSTCQMACQWHHLLACAVCDHLHLQVRL